MSLLIQCGSWIKVRIQRMEPDLYDIGENAEDVKQLREMHASLVSKLAAKQTQISELLSKAEEMVSQQPTEGQARVYSAMSSSLNKAWRELLDVLGRRGHLLQLVADIYENAQCVHKTVARIIQQSALGEWGDSVDSVQKLIDVSYFFPHQLFMLFISFLLQSVSNQRFNTPVVRLSI